MVREDRARGKMVWAFALPRGEAPDVEVVIVEAGGPPFGQVLDFELHLIRLHRLAAHGALRPAPRSAPCATRLHRWQLSTLDGFPGFLAQGGLVVHLAGLVVHSADASRPTPGIRVLTEQEPSITPIRTSSRSGRICGRKGRVPETIRRVLLTTSAATATPTCRRGGAQEGRGRTVTRIALDARRRWLRNGEIPPNRIGENCRSRARERSESVSQYPFSASPTAPAPPSARSPTDEPEANHPDADEPARRERRRTAHVAWWAAPAFSPVAPWTRAGGSRCSGSALSAPG